MKIKLANILVGILLLTGITLGQEYTGPMSSIRYPTNVVFISPNYTNKLPHYSTIANALSYLGNKATTQNPYVIWFDTDTSKVTDWATQKDSLRSQYVRTGKIKIAGFFQEGITGIVGGGGSDLTVPTPDQPTHYYEWWTWNPSDPELPIWVAYLASTLLMIDEQVYNNRPYTPGGGIVITNDTVISVDNSYIDGLVTDGIADANALTDNSHIVYDNTTETIRAPWTFKNTGLNMGDSSYLRIPLNNWSEGLSRVLWGSSDNKLHYSGSGGESSYRTIPTISDDTGYLTDDSIIVWDNFSQAVKDSIQWLPVFGSLYITPSDPDTIAISSVYAIRDFSTGVYTNVSMTDSSFIIPVNGYYRISFTLTIDGTSDTVVVQLYRNDVASSYLDITSDNNASSFTVSGSNIIYCSTLDVLELKLQCDTPSAIVRKGTFNIERIRN